MIIVPRRMGKTYSATVDQRVVKSETCEACGTPFVYLLTRSFTAHGYSFLWLNNLGAQQRALDSANKTLDKTFKKAVDFIPCPACGHYQRKMIRRRKVRNLLILAGCLIAYFVIFTLCAPEPKEVPRTPGLFYAGPPEKVQDPRVRTVLFSTLAIFPCLALWLLLRNYNANAIQRAGKPTRNVMLQQNFEQEKLAGNRPFGILPSRI